MVSFQKEEIEIKKKSKNLQLLIEKFTVYNMSAPHKRGIPKLKEDNAHVTLDPTDCSQGIVYCCEPSPNHFHISYNWGLTLDIYEVKHYVISFDMTTVQMDEFYNMKKNS